MGLLLASYTRVFLLVFGNMLMAFSAFVSVSPGRQGDRPPSNPPSERSGRTISKAFLSVVSVVFFSCVVVNLLGMARR